MSERVSVWLEDLDKTAKALAVDEDGPRSAWIASRNI